MLMEKEYEIKYYEQNMNGDLKEASLLNILQDIATLSAESLGFGPSFVFANNYAWVVLKYHIEIYKELRNYSSIRILTEPRGLSKLYAFRDFKLFSPTKELVGRVASTWSLIDMKTRHLLPMQKTLPMMIPFEKRDDDLAYSKIEPIENVSYIKDFDVRYDDIDVNHHANNSNYIVWALETLPCEFRKTHCAKIIDIRYRKEIGLNGKIFSTVEEKKDLDFVYTLHSIKNAQTEEELCDIKVCWMSC